MKRKEKENQNQPEINASELWLRMREPTGAGSGKLLTRCVRLLGSEVKETG